MPAPSRGSNSARRPRNAGTKFNQIKPPVRQVRPAPVTSDVHVADGVRLQKVLADAGFGSRRKAEELIAEARVEVDGQIVTELGVRVDPTKQVIHVDGLRVQLDTAKVTLAANKPAGMVSAMEDPEGRPTLADLVKDRDQRLFHVGRLDLDSEGLILLTNDGELANRLAHPKYEVPKTYLVTVTGGEMYPRLIKRLLDGVDLPPAFNPRVPVERRTAAANDEGGVVRADRVKVVQSLGDKVLVEVVLHSGKNRVVRRMFEEIGRPVERLVRTRIGNIALGELKPGRTRVLGRDELGALMASVDL